MSNTLTQRLHITAGATPYKDPTMHTANEARFLELLQCLADLLSYREPDGSSATLRTLLTGIWYAVPAVRGGQNRKGRENDVMQRLEWRVKSDLKDPSSYNKAMQILKAIIPLGIDLMLPFDAWTENSSSLLSTIKTQTGIDLAV